MRRTIIFAMAGTAALCLAGCGPAPLTEDETSTSESGYVSPLASHLGYDLDFAWDTESGSGQEQYLRFGDLVSTCMRSEGFDWFAPPLQVRSNYYQVDSGTGLLWGSEEWVGVYGLGISTMAFPQVDLPDDLVGHEDDLDVENDRNAEYFDSLSPEAAASYEDELYGTSEDLGCIAESEELAFGNVYSEKEERFYEEFGAEIDDMFDSMDRDLRFEEHEARVRECLAIEGYSYAGFDAIEEGLMNQLSSVDLSTDSGISRLRNIQEDEVSIAIAMTKCGGGIFEITKLIDDIRIEAEAHFVEELGSELESVVLPDG